MPQEPQVKVTFTVTLPLHRAAILIAAANSTDGDDPTLKKELPLPLFDDPNKEAPCPEKDTHSASPKAPSRASASARPGSSSPKRATSK